MVSQIDESTVVDDALHLTFADDGSLHPVIGKLRSEQFRRPISEFCPHTPIDIRVSEGELQFQHRVVTRNRRDRTQ